MKIIILSENTAGGKFLAEHGLSYLIEHNGKYILFDTGHSDVFFKNAAQMGIDLQETIDTVVLSHGHWDHGGGLGYLENKPLITHPDAFISRFRKRDHTAIGLELNKNELEKRYQLVIKDHPYTIYPEFIFLGAVPRLNNFEAQSTPFIDENDKDDFVPDDSALAINLNGELVIVSGCAHSGICNIVEYAKKITGVDRIKAVIGGFHLKENNLQTQKTIQYFEKNKVEILYPSHCTELPALAAFYEVFKIQQLKTGMVLNF